MKVVFLDIDGVLITQRSMRRLGNAREPDPKCVARLNRITNATGAKIVVSSIWRMFDGIDTVLKDWGVTGEVFGRTPRPVFRKGKSCVVLPRGEEINLWLRDTECQVDAWVILDDDPNLEPVSSGAIVTDFRIGLTERHVKAAIDLLGIRDAITSLPVIGR